MNQARRIQRIHEPFVEVKIRLGGDITAVDLWREDHFLYTANSPLDGTVTQRYLVLDFGLEERAQVVLDPEASTPTPLLDGAGQPTVEWVRTGAVQVELQRVTDSGLGMSVPTTKMIPPVEDREVQTGWMGWVHVADSTRRPARDDLDQLIADECAADPQFAEALAKEMIASWREQDAHVGLSLNYTDRRCYVCDEDWPCAKATDYDATADVPE